MNILKTLNKTPPPKGQKPYPKRDKNPNSCRDRDGLAGTINEFCNVVEICILIIDIMLIINNLPTLTQY